MILLIDNYDSFVYNLRHYFLELGYDTHVVRNDALSCEDITKLKPTHIVISPGPCGPDEAGISVPLVQQFSGVIPILGVCLGHQAIARALGGVIQRASQPMHGKAHPIFHTGEGIFKNLPHPLPAGRYHSLLVEATMLPECLNVTAWTEPEHEIMALQHRQHATFGVQFHPESILTEQGHRLLENFLSYTQSG